MTAPAWPLTAGPQDPPVITGGGPWQPRVVDAFPVAHDAALDDYVPVTPETCGVADDPVAQVLYLRSLVDELIAGMTDGQRADLAQYERPVRLLREVA